MRSRLPPEVLLYRMSYDPKKLARFRPSLLAVLLMSVACGDDGGFSDMDGGVGSDAQPMDDCASDPVTGDSLRAARAALDSGETSVAVSERGCLRYERVVSGDRLDSETITDDGVVVLSIARTDAMTTMSADADRDGSEDWSRVVTRGTTSQEDVMVETTWSAAHAPVTRGTYTWVDEETIHVVIERDDGSGTLVEAAEYDTPRWQPSHGGESSDEWSVEMRESTPPLAITTSGCSAADGMLISQRLAEAMDGVPGDPRSGGLACLHRNRFPRDRLMRVIAAYMRDIEITCDPSLALTAVYDGHGSFDGPFSMNATSLRVNPTTFATRTVPNQRQLLFHEMLHELGLHDTSLLGNPRIEEIDPTEACATMCSEGTIVTRCHCAMCLGSDVCDPRCAGFAPCAPIPEYHGMLPCPDDPCNPRLHDEASVRMNCRFRGRGGNMAMERLVSEAEVTWTVDSIDRNLVTLRPAGTIAYFQWLPPGTPCSIEPAEAPPIQSSDGMLILDYTDAMSPTYRGHGVTSWPGALVCPYGSSSVPLSSAWFWTDAVAYPYTPQSAITGTHTVADVTGVWSFAPAPPQ